MHKLQRQWLALLTVIIGLYILIPFAEPRGGHIEAASGHITSFPEAIQQHQGQILRPGAKGDAVYSLQIVINHITKADLIVDGVYGSKTVASVKQFQRQNGLKADGIVGPKTWQAILNQLRRSTQIHKVAPGETLSRIGRIYGVPLRRLVEINQLRNPDLLPVGLELLIPLSDGGSSGGSVDKGIPAATDNSTNNAKESTQPDGVPDKRQANTLNSPIPQVGTTGPMAITFNNGPDHQMLPRLIEILDRFHVRATFFISGEQAAQDPDLIRQLTAHGHEIENYGWSRSKMATSSSILTLQIRRAQRVLTEHSQRPPKFFRPPLAKIDPYVMQAARWAGLGIVLWTNVGAEDRPGVTAADLQRWLSDAAYPGAIIMLHGDNIEAINALEQLLPQWHEKGMKFLTLDELLSRGAQWPSFSGQHHLIPYSEVSRSAS